ncbi:MAG: DUF2851 family protein [Dehalococcoidia bacterium]|nr:DUF2851 family protein [Dehalococcoidia bacterium]
MRQWRMSAGRTLKTVEGERFTVVYPGLCPGGGGPDFRDAMMLFDTRKVVLGDVEVHGCTSDWVSHGHSADPAYRNVALHVVGDGNGESRTVLDDGRTVPVVVVGVPAMEAFDGRLPCNGRAETTVLSVLRGAGIERLRERAIRLEPELTQRGWEAVLFGCIGRALGYSSNTGAFEELVRRVCVPSVKDALLACSQEERRACMVGMAGLLPQQRGHRGVLVKDDVPRWEETWRNVMSGMKEMSPLDWNLRSIYPNNFPVRRLVAFADLLPSLSELSRSAQATIAYWLPDEDVSDERLETRLMVKGCEYWRTHYDFGRLTRESDVLGLSKARNIVVNAVVTCAYAHASVLADMEVRRTVIAFFARCPSAGVHAITRHMCRQLGVRHRDLVAVTEQGLIHIYRRYCREGLCFVCPLNQGRGGSVR